MDTLLICIQNEARAMSELVDILHSEQLLLMQAPSPSLMDEINQVTQSKNSQIANLAYLAKARRSELLRMGFNSTESSVPAWLQTTEQKESWKALVKVTKSAKDINRVNGLLINKHLLRNQSTLQVLYKLHRGDSSGSLYGANGQSKTLRSTGRGFIV